MNIVLILGSRAAIELPLAVKTLTVGRLAPESAWMNRVAGGRRDGFQQWKPEHEACLP